jgi:hypothetical protein
MAEVIQQNSFYVADFEFQNSNYMIFFKKTTAPASLLGPCPRRPGSAEGLFM